MKVVLFFFTMMLMVGIALSLTFLSLKEEGVSTTKRTASQRLTLFPDQCIDTMKVSRDRARELGSDPNARVVINRSIREIASMGATCVAVGTPYDDEFIPYLTLWVEEARTAKLRVWFRGNWAGWEGWFNYPKNLTPEARLIKTVAFIKKYPNLFQDGDIFSPSVEPENGGPFTPINSPEKSRQLKSYLLKEQTTVREAFQAIRKNVSTSRVSLSGGVAKQVIDKELLLALDNIVTLDHYVSDPKGIPEFIQLFQDPYKAHLVFGEFGAPIPDLNGEMSEAQQAAFVDKLLWEFFLERDVVEGVNYWTLSDSSTQLINSDGTERQVVTVIKKYFMPGKVSVTVQDQRGHPLPGVVVSTQNATVTTRTDRFGRAELLLPQGSYTITVMSPTGKKHEVEVTLASQDEVVITTITAGSTLQTFR